MYSLLISQTHFLSNQVTSLDYKSLIIYKKAFHQIVSGKPHLVLSGPTELRPFQDLKTTGNLFLREFVPNHQKHRCKFLRYSDIIMPPVGTFRHILIPPGHCKMEKSTYLLRILPPSIAGFVYFSQRIHTSYMQSRWPSASVHICIIYILPAFLLPIKLCKEVFHLCIG